MKLVLRTLGLIWILLTLSAGTALAVTVVATPTSANVGQTVAVSVSTMPSQPSCPMYINFGDGQSTTFTCTAVTSINCGANFNHTYASAGNYTVTSGASGAACSGAPPVGTTFVTVIGPCPSLGITSSDNLPNGSAGQSYTNQILTSGGTPPIGFSLLQPGSLPPGISLTSSGLLTGVPTTTGNWLFAVQAIGSCT